MCFNGVCIWGGETMSIHKAFGVFWSYFVVLYFIDVYHCCNIY